MTTQGNKTVQVGQLIEAAYDQAAQFSSDPDEVSRLASIAVTRILLRHRRPLVGPSRKQHALFAR